MIKLGRKSQISREKQSAVSTIWGFNSLWPRIVHILTITIILLYYPKSKGIYQVQSGWKESDSQDQKFCPVLSNIFRFFPPLSIFFQCQSFSNQTYIFRRFFYSLYFMVTWICTLYTLYFLVTWRFVTLHTISVWYRLYLSSRNEFLIELQSGANYPDIRSNKHSPTLFSTLFCVKFQKLSSLKHVHLTWAKDIFCEKCLEIIWRATWEICQKKNVFIISIWLYSSKVSEVW